MKRKPVIPIENPIILYDGVCGLCDRLVRFVLKHDQRGFFRFAALQGHFAAKALAHHGKDAAQLEAMCVIAGEKSRPEELLCKSDAAIFVLRQLNWPWKAAVLLKIVPRGLRDRAYDWIARRRYRIFGKLERCRVPSEAERARFIS